MAADSPADGRTPPTAGDSMHRCAAGRSCRDAVIDGDTRAPAVIAEPRGLCRRCRAAVDRAVESLQTDYARLARALAEKPTGARDRVAGTPEPPIPINTAAEALSRSLAEWADCALGVVAAAMNIALDRVLVYQGRGYPRRDAAIVAAAEVIVKPNVDRLLDAPCQPVSIWRRNGEGWRVVEMDGYDIALRMVWVHRQVAALDDGNPRERLAMPCPVLDCGAPTLGRNNGSTDVTCTTCGGRWTEREYAWLAGLLVADIREEETMADTLAEARLAREIAEQQLALANSKLDKLRKVGNFTPDDIGSCSAMDIVTLVNELVD